MGRRRLGLVISNRAKQISEKLSNLSLSENNNVQTELNGEKCQQEISA